MKNLIFISILLAAGTLAAFANELTGTYTDEAGEQQNFVFDEKDFYTYNLVLTGSGTYENVMIFSYDFIIDVNVYIYPGVTFEGFIFSGMPTEEGSHLYFYGYPSSVIGGSVRFSNIESSYIYSKLSSGTNFSIDSSSRVYFYSNIWDIAAADLTQPLIDGEGWVGMNSSNTFTLNFLSEELLQERTIRLVSESTQVDTDYSSFKDIAITLNGKEVSDYIATQINDGRDILIKFVPEPSMFGLVAGTLALALAGTRRRRRK